jgi:hypothetical protein
MTSYWQRFRQWIDKNFDNWPDALGWLMLGLGLLVFTSDYLRWSLLYVPYLSDLLLQIWPELIGIGLAVIIIDKANELIRLREEKKRLILQMGSPDNAFAIEAVRQLKARGWLFDGTLYYANIERANLSGAHLSGADLSLTYLGEANLREANLEGAIFAEANMRKAELSHADMYIALFVGADLREANLSGANLQGADFRGADLRDSNLGKADLWDADLKEAKLRRADLSGADLTKAEVTPEQLEQTKSLEGATMPDGTVYNPETFNESLEEQEPPK